MIVSADGFPFPSTGTMSAALKPLSLAEFLTWERTQPERYEFDGVQPVAMTGGSRAHSRVGTRLLVALGNRVRPPCEAFGPDLKVLTTGRIRYPDASVVCAASDDESDLVEPRVVFEVLSPSTALTDRRVKALEYAAVTSILAYVLLEQDRPEITIMRRSTGWDAETIEGADATLGLLEIDVVVPLHLIYAA
jgi:Uma2 family endonuclease